MTKRKFAKGLMWFRRDLRASDNAALYHALKSCDQVVCLFVLDKAILEPLPRCVSSVCVERSRASTPEKAAQAWPINGAEDTSENCAA